jgi:hypothetical protein
MKKLKKFNYLNQEQDKVLAFIKKNSYVLGQIGWFLSGPKYI